MRSIGAARFAEFLGGNGVASRSQKRSAISQSKDSYLPFVQLLYEDLTDIIYRLQANPQNRGGRSEDGITEEIISNLETAGYDAQHDAASGGHVDVTVKLGRYHSWIGEAKKDSKFDEGFLQLSTRYKPASGNFDHNHGGMLLYCTGNTDTMMAMSRWSNKFDDAGFKAKFTRKENFGKVEKTGCPISSSAFFTRHVHINSGGYFVVRHMMVSLQFTPQDASARKTGARRAARKVKAQSS